MGETRVDLLHLLEDLRDAYPGAIEETILTEIMANALDSGATEVAFEAEPAARALTVVDDGSGMQRRELARYHDIAASSKSRGQGIGFAGVGIKLGLLLCEEVLTETRRGSTHAASAWSLASRHRAPWKWVPPAGLVRQRGTAIRLTLQNPLSPLLDPGFLENTLRRQFQPLFDPAFDAFLAGHYPDGITVRINGQALEKHEWTAPLHAPLVIRMLRKRKPSGFGFINRETLPIAEESRGIAISTFGKVIRRGWEWMGMTPAAGDQVGGLIEVPELAACLTLNKGEFIRTGSRGATYLAYRKAIQEAVSRQLSAWGDAPASAIEAPPREVRPLERELADMLEDLADDYPLLGSLVEQRSGGQKKLPLGGSPTPGEAQSFVAASLLERAENETSEPQPPPSELAASATAATETSREPFSGSDAANVRLPGNGGRRRPARYGLNIDLEDRADDCEIARLVESTIWVNRAHPAYRRALASRSLGYHIALAVAMALAPLAVEPAAEHRFVTAFLSRWGEAVANHRGKRSQRV